MELPRPILKWAGGKRQLLPALLYEVERAGKFERYHEPFFGGGALFFAMGRKSMLGRKKPYLSDTNPNLVVTYEAVREDVDGVIQLLREHELGHCEQYYYEIRDSAPVEPTARAARIIYLNKTCYNGLYRENSRGNFNVPFGRYRNPTICDEENLRAVSTALSKANVYRQDFEAVLDTAVEGDLVYFDPPYHPMSKTSNFTAYAKDGFGEPEQRRLAEVFRNLKRRCVKVLLSNSDTPLVRELYDDFHFDRLEAKRPINSRGDRRGTVAEALIRSY